MTKDPTAIDIEFDPLKKRMVGTTYHGNMEFDVPFVSQIEGNLWMGGCEQGLLVPDGIQHIISLYPWERYLVTTRLRSESYHWLHDADVPDEGFLRLLVDWAVYCVADAPTLIHCQAGLNRSGLISALVLVRQGWLAQDAIYLLRRRRSPAVLCNPKFEAWLKRQ